jgi:hypothetical protein
LEVNYKNIYENLISRAKSRYLNGYVERHHIIPKCLKGSNDSSNIVLLTPEEHYLAHLLLVKIHPHNRSLLYAAKMMAGKGNNKIYGWLKRRSSELGFTKEHRENISKSLKGHVYKRKPRTIEDMHARWEKNEIKRQIKKSQAIITALIYAVS